MKPGQAIPEIVRQGSDALNRDAGERLGETELEGVEHGALKTLFQRTDFALGRVIWISQDRMANGC